MTRPILAAFAACLLASCASTYDAPAAPVDPIAAAVADPRRSAEDVARDQARKPYEIVSFAGVQPGMVVAEMAPGGGYYTRILAEAVGPEGKIYALQSAFTARNPERMAAYEALAAEYGNVIVLVVQDYATLQLPEPVDLVWTTENYHDFVNAGVEPANSWAYRTLKSGGVYFIEDHSAPGTGLTATSTIHRIDPAAVAEQVIGAGFALEANSDVLANPDDPKDVGFRDFDGVTEKFALRFRKPG